MHIWVNMAFPIKYTSKIRKSLKHALTKNNSIVYTEQHQSFQLGTKIVGWPYSEQH